MICRAHGLLKCPVCETKHDLLVVGTLAVCFLLIIIALMLLAGPAHTAPTPTATPARVNIGNLAGIGSVTMSTQAVMLVRVSDDPRALPVRVVGGDVTALAVSVQASVRIPGGAIAFEAGRVVDGDTFEAVFQPFPDVEIKGRIRLLGVDCYETHAKTAAKRKLAEQGKAFTTALLSGMWQPRALVDKRDSFGRLLCQVFVTKADGTVVELGEELVKAGLAIRGVDPSRF
jgi:endonuclease YncB( thermonuclease family)